MTRLVPGFVTHCEMDGDAARKLRFANGAEAREVIVSVDDAMRRIAWSAAGGRLTHHNASAQVFDQGDGRCRVVWIADLLPDALAPAIAEMIQAEPEHYEQLGAFYQAKRDHFREQLLTTKLKPLPVL